MSDDEGIELSKVIEALKKAEDKYKDKKVWNIILTCGGDNDIIIEFLDYEKAFIKIKK